MVRTRTGSNGRCADGTDGQAGGEKNSSQFRVLHFGGSCDASMVARRRDATAM
jgi:hypothetical protein